MAIILFTFFYKQDGATPLFKAAHKGFCAVVHELLKFKPNLSILPVSTFVSFLISLNIRFFFIILTER